MVHGGGPSGRVLRSLGFALGRESSPECGVQVELGLTALFPLLPRDIPSG